MAEMLGLGIGQVNEGSEFETVLERFVGKNLGSQLSPPSTIAATCAGRTVAHVMAYGQTCEARGSEGKVRENSNAVLDVLRASFRENPVLGGVGCGLVLSRSLRPGRVILPVC